ncbi:MAG: hypothetical protein ABSH51_20675 [Solirubrobacteraceae bacterium]
MTPVLTVAARRLWPRRVRTRLAVFYAVLFLLAGVVLLALTYTLAAAVLLPGAASPPKLLTSQERALLGVCKPLPRSPSLRAQCDHMIDIVGSGPKARGTRWRRCGSRQRSASGSWPSPRPASGGSLPGGR